MDNCENVEDEVSDSRKPQYRKIQGIMGDVSFSLVLPKEFALHLGLRRGGFVKVYQDQNRIVVEKAES